MKWTKRILKIVLISFLLVITTIILVDRTVNRASEKYIFNSLDSIPSNRVGLLLGTGKFLKNGYVNLYYQYRIDATIVLYKAGKIEYVLVSGDNSNKDYDEPTTIKNDLIEGGIPANKIVLDYAGFRTLDSVVRSKLVFGQSSITIISQKFHNQRALYIATKNDINAIAFNAKSVSKSYGFKTQLREKFARVKMMLDLFFGKDPKFLGEKVEI